MSACWTHYCQNGLDGIRRLKAIPNFRVNCLMFVVALILAVSIISMLYLGQRPTMGDFSHPTGWVFNGALFFMLVGSIGLGAAACQTSVKRWFVGGQ